MNGVHETPREHPENTTEPADPQQETQPADPQTEARTPDPAAASAEAPPVGPDAVDADPAGAAAAESDEADEEIDASAPLPAEFYRCAEERTRTAGIDAARRELARHQVVVMPTDTVYGIAANAFSVQGVRRLLEAKGRDRTMPPPVLIAHTGVLDGLADEISDEARALAAAFWPGGLTLICRAQPSLQWDLGETHGTVGLRVPDDEIARAVLSETGPLAVSSANRTGMPAATTAEQARGMLGDSVRVYLEAGPRAEGRDPDPSAPAPAPVSSTIVDCTGATPVVVRDGQISLTRLREVVPSVLALDGASAPEAADGTGPDDSSPNDSSTGVSGSDVSGSAAGAPGADTDASVADASAADASAAAHGGEAIDTEASGEASGGDASSSAAGEGRSGGSTAAAAPAPQDPEADIVAQVRAERRRAEPTAMDFSAAAPAAASTAAAVVAAGGRSASGRGAPVPDQDRRRPMSSAPAGGPRPLGLAEASALVAFGSRDEPVEDETGGADGAARGAGVDQQR